jgi:hypothetical protein
MKRFRILAVLAAVAAIVGLGLQQGDVGAASLTTRVTVTVAPTLTSTVGLAATVAEAKALGDFTFTPGTGANQADSVYTASSTITTGATLTLDLKGSMVDAFGAAFTPAKLRLVYIASRNSNTTDLTLFGNAASPLILNTAATTTTLTPGDVFLATRRATAGITVTAATADIVQIVNAAGASAVVDIVLVGTSS